MDFLAAEIASKKSTLDKASKTMKKKKRKYLTAGQLRDAEEEEWKRKEDKKRKKVEERKKIERGGGEDDADSSSTNNDNNKNVNNSNTSTQREDRSSSISITDALELERMKKAGTNITGVQKKLRSMNVEVRMFGETDDGVFLRLIAIERKRIAEGKEEFALGKDSVSEGGSGGGFSKYYEVGGEEIGGEKDKGMKKKEEEERSKNERLKELGKRLAKKLEGGEGGEGGNYQDLFKSGWLG
mmetsp:Transcript_21386/g.44518  ORF Transcript_21386/g.44518 Transcript_21386/m.44518 type:complete len:241 (+) Transcript_21386:48-770(+)